MYILTNSRKAIVPKSQTISKHFLNGLAFFGTVTEKGAKVVQLKPELAVKSGRIFEDEDGEVLDDGDPRHGHDHMKEEAVLQGNKGRAESNSQRSKQIEKDVERDGDAVLITMSQTN